MDTWWAPPHQQQLKNQTTKNFGYDLRGCVDYYFNSWGFRGSEISDTASVIQIGNSISFGIGLEQSQTFGTILANHLGLPNINLSFGCWSHENHDNLINIQNISARTSQDIILVQVNNLDRRREGDMIVHDNDSSWCRQRLIDYIDRIDVLLGHKSFFLLYWDDKDHGLPSWVSNRMVIHNRGHLDRSLLNLPHTFGPKSHFFVSRVLAHSIERG